MPRHFPILIVAAALALAACTALVVPSTDGGSGADGGGTGTGGSTATGGNTGTGGSTSTGGGTGTGGSTPTGGGAGTGGSTSTGGGAGTGGGAAWPDAVNWGLTVLDAGTWSFQLKTPTRSPQPEGYGGIAGWALPDGGALVWTVDQWGGAFQRESTTWNALTIPVTASRFEGLITDGTTLFAWSGNQLFTCSGDCSSGASFVAHAAPFTLSSVCAAHGQVWVTGKAGVQLALAKFTTSFHAPIVTTAQKDAFGCLPRADGTLFVAADDVYRLDPGATDVELEPSDVPVGSQQFWHGVIESSSGHLYAYGTYARVAQRQADGTWLTVRTRSPAGEWFYAAVQLASGDLLFLGQRDPVPGGTSELLLLSEATQRWFLVEHASDFVIRSAWAAPNDTLWLSGYLVQGTSTWVGAVYRAPR